MAVLNRKTLKNFFRRGNMPTEVNFTDLIDSSVNKVDDGFSKNMEDGLQLAPTGSSRKVLSFFDNIKDASASWHISLNPTNRNKGISISDNNDDTRFFVRDGGNIGIGTMQPRFALEVNGMVGMKGRVGTYATGEIPANREWHTILSGLDSSNAFEIMAEVRGIKGRGRYAMMHAIALSTYGRSKSKIKKTHAYFGWFWNRISARWIGDVHDYSLQLRTMSNYGMDEHNEPIMIRFNVIRLWGSDDNPKPSQDSLFLPPIS
jgi:hypothetical protein